MWVLFKTNNTCTSMVFKTKYTYQNENLKNESSKDRQQT